MAFKAHSKHGEAACLSLGHYDPHSLSHLEAQPWPQLSMNSPFCLLFLIPRELLMWAGLGLDQWWGNRVEGAPGAAVSPAGESWWTMPGRTGLGPVL